MTITINGIPRHCGTLPTPSGRVSALPPFGTSANQVIWTADKVREVVTDPGRVKKRELFGASWILDQRNAGSCNGHALASAGARVRYLGGRRDGQLFSGSFPYAQMKADGTDPGSIIGDDIATCQTFGFLPLERGPANKINRRDYTADDYAEAKRHLGLEAYKLVGTFAEKILAIQTALAIGWPAIVAVMAGNRFASIANGIAGVDQGVGNHAVLLQDVRWDGSRFIYDLVNSWGTQFGEDGCAWIHDGHLKQTAGSHEFVVLPAVDFMG